VRLVIPELQRAHLPQLSTQPVPPCAITLGLARPEVCAWKQRGIETAGLGARTEGLDSPERAGERQGHRGLADREPERLPGS